MKILALILPPLCADGYRTQSAQFDEPLRRVLRLLDSLTADELHNQVVFLQQFK